MTTKRRIIAWTIATILSLPLVMIFNMDIEKLHINLIGIAYAFLLSKYASRVLPGWMVEYFTEERD